MTRSTIGRSLLTAARPRLEDPVLRLPGREEGVWGRAGFGPRAIPLDSLAPDDEEEPAPDFGASLLEPVSPPRVGRHGASAAAVSALMRHVDDLTKDPDHARYPERHAAKITELREAWARDLDEDERDGFEADLDAFAKARAADLRLVGAARVDAARRQALDKTLGRWATVAGRATGRAERDLAQARAAAVIREGVAGGLLTAEAAGALEARFRRQAAEAGFGHLMTLDPGLARSRLDDPEEFAGMDEAWRAPLRTQAEDRIAARGRDQALGGARATGRAAVAAARAREGFTTTYLGRIASGEATEEELAAAEAAGTLDGGRRRMLAERLAAHQARERAADERIALVEARLASGEGLERDDPAHRAAADDYFEQVIKPALDEHDFATVRRVLPERLRALGLVPPALARGLALWWRSGDADLAGNAAQLLVAIADDNDDGSAAATFMPKEPRQPRRTPRSVDEIDDVDERDIPFLDHDIDHARRVARMLDLGLDPDHVFDRLGWPDAATTLVHRSQMSRSYLLNLDETGSTTATETPATDSSDGHYDMADQLESAQSSEPIDPKTEVPSPKVDGSSGQASISEPKTEADDGFGAHLNRRLKGNDPEAKFAALKDLYAEPRRIRPSSIVSIPSTERSSKAQQDT